MKLPLLFNSTLIVSVALYSGACSYAPTHDIPVKPDYIHAGVQPGDTIVVTTEDGVETTIEVSEVRATAIVAGDWVIPFSDIQSISVRSWTKPPHPCGAGEPVGCSIPEVVRVLTSDLANQAPKFHAACVTHDFCYRHGFATYGFERDACDSGFYSDMQTACDSKGALSVLDISDYTLCRTAALQTYQAVRRYGENAFRTIDSTVCEY